MDEKILNSFATDIIRFVRDMNASDSKESESAKVDRLIKFIEEKDIDLEI